MTYFNSQRTGALASRITSDVQVLQDSISNVVGAGLPPPITALFLVGLLIYLDWKLAFWALGVFPICAFPNLSVRTTYSSRFRPTASSCLADLNSQVHETLAGIRVVKAFGMEKYEKNKFEKTNEYFMSAAMKHIQAFAASSPIVETDRHCFIPGPHCLVGPPVPVSATRFDGGDFGRFYRDTATLYPYLKNFNGLWGGLQNAMACGGTLF